MAVKVLFLSSFNSARSQMAEGFLRELGGAGVEVHSAGSVAYGVDPRAVIVMAERGVDISDQRATGLAECLDSAPFDYLITVCERGEDECPAVLGQGTREYWPFEDPARVEGDDSDRMAAFRDVRDRMRTRVRMWIEKHERELASRPAASSVRPIAPATAGRSVERPPVAGRQGSATDEGELAGSGRRLSS